MTIKQAENPFTVVQADALSFIDTIDTIDANERSQLVTPAVAERLLRMNRKNRTLKRPNLEKLVGIMLRGEWVVNGDTIVLDEEGYLRDGQHRLQAVVQSGVPVMMLIVTVKDGHEAQAATDNGARRTFSDMLVIDGEKNANTLGAAVRMVWNWSTYGVPLSQNIAAQPTNSQLYKILSDNPGLRSSVEKAVGKSMRSPFIANSIIAGLHYSFLLAGADEEDVDDFFSRLALGHNLSEDDAIFTLRQRLLNDSMSESSKIAQIVRVAFIIRTFNAYLIGKPIQKLIWRAGGKKPDRFPTIKIPGGSK